MSPSSFPRIMDVQIRFRKTLRCFPQVQVHQILRCVINTFGVKTIKPTQPLVFTPKIIQPYTDAIP